MSIINVPSPCTLKQFRDIVASSGFAVRVDPPSHEGMHPDDAYEPAIAIDANGDEVGMWWIQVIGDHTNTDERECAILFDNADEFNRWAHEEPAEDEAYAKTPSSVSLTRSLDDIVQTCAIEAASNRNLESIVVRYHSNDWYVLTETGWFTSTVSEDRMATMMRRSAR